MKKIILLSLISTFMYSDECHEPTGWCYFVSISQAFYIFETVTIDGNVPEEEDVLGAFCNGTMVGYANFDLESGIGLAPAMGNDGSEYTEGYCSQGDIPEFKIYDASEDQIYCTEIEYGLLSSQIEDGCQECDYIENDANWWNDCECYSGIPMWSNNMIFSFPAISNSSESDCNGDFCGDAFVDDCGICSGGNTGHYPNSDQDCAGNCFGNSEIDDCGVCNGNNSTCSGCTDACASNFDEDAIVDDGSCLTTGDTIYYNLHTGNNLKGYNGSANSITDAIPDQFETYIIQILGEGVAAQQLTPGQWVGSLSSLINGDGYWIKVSQPIEGFYFE